MANSKDPEIGVRLGLGGWMSDVQKAKTSLAGIGSVDFSPLTNKIGAIGKGFAGMAKGISGSVATIGKGLASGLAGALGGGGIAGYAGAAGGLVGGILGSLGGPGVAAASAAAGAAIATGIGKGIDTTIGAALNENRLNDRVKQVFGPENFAFLDETANKVKSAFRFDDEDAKASMNILGQMGMSAQQAANTMSLSADVARAKGMSLQDSSRLIGKAFQGNLAAAKKLGIEFTKTGDPLKDQANLMDQIQKKFAGSAAEYAKNMPPFERVKMAVEDLSKSIGQKLIPIIMPFMEWLSNSINGLLESEGFNTMIDGLVSGFKTGWGYAKQIGMTLATYGIAFFDIIEKLPAALGQLWDSGKLMELFTQLLGAMGQSMWDQMVFRGVLLKAAIMDGIPALIGFLGKALTDMLRTALGEKLSNALGLKDVSATFNQMMTDNGKNMADAAKKGYAELQEKQKANFAGIKVAAKDAFSGAGLDFSKVMDNARNKTAGMMDFSSAAKKKVADDTADLYGRTGRARNTIGMSAVARKNAMLANRKKLRKGVDKENAKARGARPANININLQSTSPINPIMATT